jgi:hypothetical protein
MQQMTIFEKIYVVLESMLMFREWFFYTPAQCTHARKDSETFQRIVTVSFCSLYNGMAKCGDNLHFQRKLLRDVVQVTYVHVIANRHS